MIISHKHKFIFIKTRKTAGTSVEIALSSICGEEDIIARIAAPDELARKKLGFLGAQNYHIPFGKYSRRDWAKAVLHRQKRLEYYRHISCAELVEYIEPEIWNTYYKFTIDRNPFDKAVSMFYFRKADEKYESITEFIADGGLGEMRSFDLYTIRGVLAVDKIYKYEEMDYFLKDISTKLNLDTPLKLPQYKAKSKFRKKANYKDVLDAEAIELIKTIYAREIQLLDYEY